MSSLLRDAIALGDGCLRAIVRTGQREHDSLAAAIEAASFEDVALLAIAMNRTTNEGERHANAELQR